MTIMGRIKAAIEEANSNSKLKKAKSELIRLSNLLANAVVKGSQKDIDKIQEQVDKQKRVVKDLEGNSAPSNKKPKESKKENKSPEAKEVKVNVKKLGAQMHEFADKESNIRRQLRNLEDKEKEGELDNKQKELKKHLEDSLKAVNKKWKAVSDTYNKEMEKKEDKWWAKLSKEKKAAYIKKHPNSKYANQSGGGKAGGKK